MFGKIDQTSQTPRRACEANRNLSFSQERKNHAFWYSHRRRRCSRRRNPAIKAVVMRARAEGHEMVGSRRGWASAGWNFNLYDVAGSRRAADHAAWMKARCARFDRTGGTFSHTSRTNPSSVKPADVPDFLNRLAIYGDGTAVKYDFTPHVLEVGAHTSSWMRTHHHWRR